MQTVASKQQLCFVKVSGFFFLFLIYNWLNLRMGNPQIGRGDCTEFLIVLDKKKVFKTMKT